MRRRPLLVAAAVLGVLVVAGVAAVPVLERLLAERLKADIERDGTRTVGKVEVGFWDRSLTLSDLAVRGLSQVTIKRWRADGLAWPLSELLAGRTPLAGLRPGDPLSAAHIELEKLKLEDPGGSLSVDRLLGEGLVLGRYDPQVGLGQFTTLTMRILAALSVRRLEQHDLKISLPMQGQSVGVAELVVEQLERGKAGTFKLANLAAGPADGSEPTVRVAELKAAGLDARRPIEALSDIAWRPGLPVGRWEIDSASASGFGGRAFVRYGLALDSIVLESEHASREPGRQMVRTRLRVAGFTLAPPLLNREALQLRIALQAMGLNELKLELDCAFTEDHPQGEARVDRCALTGRDLGVVEWTLKFVRADDRFWQAVDRGDAALLRESTIALGGASVTINDKGLLERSLRLTAVTSGQSVAAARSAVARDVRRFQPSGVLITEQLTSLLDTIARFVEQGGTLVVEAKPDPPVGLGRSSALLTPGPDLVEILNLTAKLGR